jgi:hypothetical protein
VLPVFAFEERSDAAVRRPSAPLLPLRHYTHCTPLGAAAAPRVLANTFWAWGPAGTHGFSFAANQLPVTDAGWPWVPAIADMEADPSRAVLSFGGNSGGAAEQERELLKQFHLDGPLGDVLAVFSYPPARQARDAAALPREAERCPSGLAAAQACCPWGAELLF